MAFRVIKEIHSRQGVLHFKRWLLLKTPWFDVYLHHILQGDQDADPHNHPWEFVGVLLRGSYDDGRGIKRPLRPFHMPRTAYHQVKLLSKDVWSVLFVGKDRGPWGYLTPTGHIDHEEYRRLKKRVW